MKRKSIIISLLALLLIFPTLAQAAPVGKFTSIEGNVDVTAPGKEAVPAKPGDPLNVGDIIRTKSKSKCEVAFIDGNILRLAENSRLRVTEFSGEKEQRIATLNLFRGKSQNIVKTVTGAAAAQSKYEIHMPTAVAGVRGTNFFAYYLAGVSGAIFKEGTGYGYSLNRPKDVRTIHYGQAMVVTSPDVPPVIMPATALELKQHEKDTAPAEKPKEEGKKEGEKKPAENIEKIVIASAQADINEQSARADIREQSRRADIEPKILPQKNVVERQIEEVEVEGVTDTDLPSITLSGLPAPVTNVNSANIQVSINEPSTSTTTLTRNGVLVASPNWSALQDGNYVFSVSATDLAGNTASTSYSWTVDTQAPTIALSGTPAPLTNVSSANIVVTTTEQATYTATLARNGQAVANPDWAALQDGNYVFSVSATDLAGNTASTSYSWTVETQLPIISFSWPSNTPANITTPLTNEYVSPDIRLSASVVRWNAFSSILDWGSWQNIMGGVYNGAIAGAVNTAWTMERSYMVGLDTTYVASAATWDVADNTIKGQAVMALATANWEDAKTLVGSGVIRGVFNPNDSPKTWQTVTTGEWIETTKFLDMQGGKTITADADATLKALNIPAVMVGQANLTQGAGEVNNLSGVTMSNVGFFAYSTNEAPKIWATNNVSGSYRAAPATVGQVGYQAVPLTGGSLTASFGINSWQTGAWGANVTGGGALSGGSYNGTVNFKGGAAGTINNNGTFGANSNVPGSYGTAAGIVK